MGYMGFGMQNWIFRQRPRKAFSKERKSSGGEVNYTGSDEMDIEGRTRKNAELAEKEKLEYLQKISKRNFKEKIFAAIIFLSVVSGIVLLIWLKPWHKIKYSDQYWMEDQVKINEEIRERFKLFMEYGDYFLENNEFERAGKEYGNALKLFPDDSAANVGFAKSYMQDCLLNHRNCDKAKSAIHKLIEKYPDNPEYISYGIGLENLDETK